MGSECIHEQIISLLKPNLIYVINHLTKRKIAMVKTARLIKSWISNPALEAGLKWSSCRNKKLIDSNLRISIFYLMEPLQIMINCPYVSCLMHENLAAKATNNNTVLSTHGDVLIN